MFTSQCSRTPSNPDCSFGFTKSESHRWFFPAVVFLLLFALASSVAAGNLYLRGPDDRGEGPLPIVTGVPPDIPNMGSFTVDVYAEDFPGFAAFQIQIDFPSGFYRYGTLTRNQLFLPDASTINNGAIVGAMSQELIDPFDPGLGYADKSIPREEDDEAVNPVEMIWQGHEGLTWLMTITFLYDATAGGTYPVDAVAEVTTFGDADALPLSYSVTAGSLTIGGERGDGEDGGDDGEGLMSLTLQTDAGTTEMLLTDGDDGGDGLRDGDCFLIRGNAVRDESVNVLDMIRVRNNLNAPQPLEGDAFRSDVNANGSVNILDLIFVRNHLNQAEPLPMTAAWESTSVSTTDTEPAVVLPLTADAGGLTEVEFAVEAWLAEELNWTATSEDVQDFSATFADEGGTMRLLFSPGWHALDSYDVVVTAAPKIGGCGRAVTLSFTDANSYLSVSPATDNVVYSPVNSPKAVTAAIDGPMVPPGGTWEWGPAQLVLAANGNSAQLVSAEAGEHPAWVKYTASDITRTHHFTFTAFEARLERAVRPDASETSLTDVYTGLGTTELHPVVYPQVPGNVSWNTWQVSEEQVEHVDFGYENDWAYSVTTIGGVAQVAIADYGDGFDLKCWTSASTDYGTATMPENRMPHVLLPTVALEIAGLRWTDDSRIPGSGRQQAGAIYFGAPSGVSIDAVASPLRADAPLDYEWELLTGEADLWGVGDNALLLLDESTSLEIALIVSIGDFTIGTFSIDAKAWCIVPPVDRFYVGTSQQGPDHLHIPVEAQHAPDNLDIGPEPDTNDGQWVDYAGGVTLKWDHAPGPSSESPWLTEIVTSRTIDNEIDRIYEAYPATFEAVVRRYSLSALAGCQELFVSVTTDPHSFIYYQNEGGDFTITSSGVLTRSIELFTKPSLPDDLPITCTWSITNDGAGTCSLQGSTGLSNTAELPVQTNVHWDNRISHFTVTAEVTPDYPGYDAAGATINCTFLVNYADDDCDFLLAHDAEQFVVWTGVPHDNILYPLPTQLPPGHEFFMDLRWSDDGIAGYPSGTDWDGIGDGTDWDGPDPDHGNIAVYLDVDGVPWWTDYPTHLVVIPLKLELDACSFQSSETPIIGCNDDDDDGDGIVDSEDEDGVAGEDDLLAVRVRFASSLGFLRSHGARLEVEHTPNIRLWATHDKTVEYTGDTPTEAGVPSHLADWLFVEGLEPTSNETGASFSVRLVKEVEGGTEESVRTLDLSVARLEFLTRYPGSEEAEFVESVTFTSEPVPEVEMEVVGTSLTPEGQLSVLLRGSVRDHLSDLADDPDDRVQALVFTANGEPVHALTGLAAQCEAPGVMPWEPHKFLVEFETELVLDSPGGSTWIIRAETTPNAAGNTGWAWLGITVLYEEVSEALPGIEGLDDGLTITFDATPDDQQPDCARIYFGDRPPEPGDGEICEEAEAPASLDFSGVLMLGAPADPIPCRVVIAGPVIFNSGEIDEFRATVTYSPAAKPPVCVTATWSETAEASLRFIQQGDLVPGSLLLQPEEPGGGALYVPVVRYISETSTSPEGNFEPLLLRFLSDDAAADYISVEVNDIEQELKPFIFSPKTYYLVFRPYNEDHPRIYVVTAEPPQGMESVIPQNFEITNRSGDLKALLEYSQYTETKVLKTGATLLVYPWEDPDAPLPPSNALTEEFLLPYFHFLYGDNGLALLGYFQQAGNNLLLCDVWGDLKVTGFLPGDITIKVEEDTTPIKASHLLWTGLLKALPYYQAHIPIEQLELLQQAREQMVGEAAHLAVGAANAYLTCLAIANEGADWVITIDELSKGHWEAALGLLPLISSTLAKTGGQLVIRNADNLLCSFADDVAGALKEAGLKKGMAFKERLLRFKASLHRELPLEELKHLVNSGEELLGPPTNHKQLRRLKEAELTPNQFAMVRRSADCHHELPWQFKKEFAELGLDVNDPQFGKWVNKADHNKITYSCKEFADKYNDEWAKWFKKPFSERSEEGVRQMLEELRSKYETLYRKF